MGDSGLVAAALDISCTCMALDAVGGVKVCCEMLDAGGDIACCGEETLLAGCGGIDTRTGCVFFCSAVGSAFHFAFLSGLGGSTTLIF